MVFGKWRHKAVPVGRVLGASTDVSREEWRSACRGSQQTQGKRAHGRLGTTLNCVLCPLQRSGMTSHAYTPIYGCAHSSASRRDTSTCIASRKLGRDPDVPSSLHRDGTGPSSMGVAQPTMQPALSLMCTAATGKGAWTAAGGPWTAHAGSTCESLSALITL